MLLGSVALHCVVHAPCPVMVVPVGRAGAAAG
jgi:nucleotide-binding universal stress UspA family protein